MHTSGSVPSLCRRCPTRPTPRALLIAPALFGLLSAAAYAQVPIVNWSGDYVTSSQSLPARNGGTTSNGDFGGPGPNPDYRRLVAYSETTARNPTIGPSYGTSTGQSARFYGGLDVIELNGTTTPNHDDWNIVQNTAGDRINVRIQPNSGTTGETFGLYTWLKADFLNGYDAQTVELSSLSVMLIENAYTLRWVVKNDGQYYISDQTATGTGTKSLNLATAEWSSYDPIIQIRFDAAMATFAPVAMDDVEAVGLYYQELNQPSSARRLTISAVTAQAALSGPTTPTDLALSASIIQTAAFNGTVVGTITNTDLDLTGPYVYTLLDDAGGRFAISGDQLTVADGSMLDRSLNTTHSVTIQVLDSGTGGTYSEPFTINVTLAEDVNASGAVSAADVTAVVQAFGLDPAPGNFADVDRNGVVNLLDLARVLSALGLSI